MVPRIRPQISLILFVELSGCFYASQSLRITLRVSIICVSDWWFRLYVGPVERRFRFLAPNKPDLHIMAAQQRMRLGNTDGISSMKSASLFFSSSRPDNSRSHIYEDKPVCATKPPHNQQPRRILPAYKHQHRISTPIQKPPQAQNGRNQIPLRQIEEKTAAKDRSRQPVEGSP
jgi:hypothetical protein